jgi:RimJ/RimL family protein N-acetyltransferase
MTTANKHGAAYPKHISFRLVAESDAPFIFALRSDSKKNKHLSATVGSLDAQIEWIRTYKHREQAEQEFYYIIEGAAHEQLGVVRLYDFQGNSFCWGSWILIDDAPFYASIESALLVYEIAFYQLGFEKSHFDVRKQNKRVLDFHTRFGAEITHEDADNYFLKLEKPVYEETKKHYRKFIKND